LHTMNQEPETIKLFHSGSTLAVPTVFITPIFATVRIFKGTKQIRDGRIYKTKAGMRTYRKTRPANATCIKIIRRLPHGLIECELV
jgi:hypothetical protein